MVPRNSRYTSQHMLSERQVGSTIIWMWYVCVDHDLSRGRCEKFVTNLSINICFRPAFFFSRAKVGCRKRQLRKACVRTIRSESTIDRGHKTHIRYTSYYVTKKCTQCVLRSGGGVLIFVHGRSRMTRHPRIPTRPGRSTLGFHQPGRQCLHQARSAVWCLASRMKGELHPTKNRFWGGLAYGRQLQ